MNGVSRDGEVVQQREHSVTDCHTWSMPVSSLIQTLEIIQDFNTGAGIISNLILLYIIKRFSSTDLGSYKYLLTVFSTNDILLTILHMILRPKNIIIGTVFSLVADGPVESKHLSAFYSAAFTLPFSLMSFHFIYRYWAIKSPYRLELFTDVRFVSGLVSYVVVESFLWYLLVLFGTTGHYEDDAVREVRQVFRETYGKNIEHGWVILDNWRNDQFNLRSFLVTLICDSVISVKIVLSLTLAVNTLRAIRTSSTVSHYTRRYHVQVLMTLCAQTVFPLIFVFFPYFCSITFPLVKLSVSFISPICIPLISFFPSWDAPIVIFLIRDYREGVREMCTRLFSSKTTEVKVISIDSIGRSASALSAKPQ